MFHFFSFFFSIFLISMSFNIQAKEKLILTPQFVIDQVLEKSYEKRLIDIHYLKNEYPLAQARGVYDPSITASTQYGKSKADSLTGVQNDLDTTLSYGLDLSKRFFTGTDLSLQFNRFQQRSDLGFQSSPNQNSLIFQDKISIGFKQPIIGNFFGIVDRRNVKINTLRLESARLLRDENIEQLVLNTLDLFWKTYIAKESLKEAIAARTKYESLVKNLEKKSKFGLSDAADYPRALSELEDHERNVKRSSLDYLNHLDLLFDIMQMENVNDVELSAPNTLPPPPKEHATETDTNSLRKIQSSQKIVHAQEYLFQASKINQLPELSIFGKAEYSGVERTPKDSFSEMASLKKPNYIIGLELKYLFNSELNRGIRNNQEYLLDEAQTNYHKEISNKKIEIASIHREVLANYQIAKSTIDTVERRKKVVQEQERSYRQGRLDLSQLIIDYNALFRSMSAKAVAFGQYHISLNHYAATKDELLKLDASTTSLK